ncbi:MAG: hypothetical protein RLZZ216_2259 [Cyanobacteriota bacterium]|jgi:hypothetical protein
MATLQIRPLQPNQVDRLTDWARREGFAPGLGDVEIYRHTDRQGLWIGWLGSEPVGCTSWPEHREPSPRPHFLADWLAHRAGTVKALIDCEGRCHGFGRIRPCLELD